MKSQEFEALVQKHFIPATIEDPDATHLTLDQIIRHLEIAGGVSLKLIPKDKIQYLLVESGLSIHTPGQDRAKRTFPVYIKNQHSEMEAFQNYAYGEIILLKRYQIAILILIGFVFGLLIILFSQV